MRTVNWFQLLVLIAGLTACSRAPAQIVDPNPEAPTAPPDHIFVAYFSIVPERVRLDRGVGARIVRVAGDKPVDAKALRAVRVLQAELALGLVRRLKTYGLSAEIATNNTGGGSGFLVQGQIVGVSPDDRTRRVLIGLGGGGGIDADTQLYQLTATAPPRFLTGFEGQADGGGTQDADQLVDAIAPRIGAFAVTQGWIPQGALK